MTESETHEHGTDGASAGTALFPSSEVEILHVEDREAARNIVCLLAGLFIVGLVLYTFVCIWTG